LGGSPGHGIRYIKYNLGTRPITFERTNCLAIFCGQRFSSASVLFGRTFEVWPWTSLPTKPPCVLHCWWYDSGLINPFGIGHGIRYIKYNLGTRPITFERTNCLAIFCGQRFPHGLLENRCPQKIARQLVRSNVIGRVPKLYFIFHAQLLKSSHTKEGQEELFSGLEHEDKDDSKSQRSTNSTIRRESSPWPSGKPLPAEDS
jgi:hypothetical protein